MTLKAIIHEAIEGWLLAAESEEGLSGGRTIEVAV